MKSRSCLGICLILCHFIWMSVCVETTQRAEKRFDIKGKEWVAAQKIINKLVDESIASRVKEAEHDVEHLLESNIADHIKNTGKTILRKLPTECHDKIEHCQTLSKSGVCKTSPKAMREHCAKTCNLCEDHFVATPEIRVNLKQDTKKLAKKHPDIPQIKTQAPQKITKLVPEKPKDGKTVRKNEFARYGEEFIPEDTIKILHSIEPLLSQQTKGVMKFHENDLSPENEKIRDAQKLLEYVKVLQPPKKFKFLEEKLSSAKDKKKSTTLRTAKKEEKHEDEDKEEEKESESKQRDEIRDKQKPKHTTKAVVKTVVKKKKLKVKGTPLTSLSKTVTYKNHKYKITPVVDWERISKMLESLGYKAVHIVGVKDKNIHHDITQHLKKHGVDKVLVHKEKEKVAAESFVSAVHREKSWHNDEYFKSHCHPMCGHLCVSSCLPGCCPQHDKVSVKTGLAKHCHSSCLTDCVPACGSGCCSADEERKRGHHFLHYQRIKDYYKARDKAEEKKKALAKQHDEPKKAKKGCHPQCLQTCVMSCGKGCCTEEGERMRDEQERKQKDEMEKKRKEKERAEALEKEQRDKALKEIYKPQARLCPAPCPEVCAPSCADDCCSFGKYAPSSPGMPPVEQPHPAFVPNVPYPHSKVIPIEAFACKESCKFSCTYDCPRDCCQPEEVALEQAHEAAALPPPTTVGAPQSLSFQDFAPAAAASTCPSPCPGGCFPSCTVACCTSALGLPQSNDAELSPEARSSTNRVLHVTHLVQPVMGFNGCALSCASHCTPACARSGCCDSAKRKKRSSSKI